MLYRSLNKCFYVFRGYILTFILFYIFISMRVFENIFYFVLRLMENGDCNPQYKSARVMQSTKKKYFKLFLAYSTIVGIHVIFLFIQTCCGFGSYTQWVLFFKSIEHYKIYYLEYLFKINYGFVINKIPRLYFILFFKLLNTFIL